MHDNLQALAITELLKRRQQNLLQSVKLDECRANFDAFNRWVFSELNPGKKLKSTWHLGYIGEHIQAMVLGQIRNLVVNLPPREWKSGTFSIALPAYLLGLSPAEKILNATYSIRLSIDLSVSCRRIIEAPFYQLLFPDTQLAPDQNEKLKYDTTHHGMRMGVSVDSSVTGFGGNWKIIDDPHDPRRANSASELNNAITWYKETWSSRVDDPELVREAVVMQRLAINDLTNYIESVNPHVTIIRLPRVAETRTTVIFPLSKRTLVREVGDILNADRVSAEIVESKRIDLGEYGFASQEQQQPIPRGGDRIKESWFPLYDSFADKYERIVMSFDTASKAEEINNPSGCLVFGKIGKQWDIIHYWLDRKTFPALIRIIVTLAEEQSPHSIIIEDKSTGTSLIQAFRDKENGLPSLPITAFDPSGKGSKVERMDNVTNFLEAGIIRLPDPKLNLPWRSRLTRDLFSFPTPVLWEPIDCLSQFLYVELRSKLKHKLNLGIPSLTKEVAYYAE